MTKNLILGLIGAGLLIVVIGGSKVTAEYQPDTHDSATTIRDMTNMYQQYNEAFFYGALPVDRTKIKFMDSDLNMASLTHYQDDTWGILIDRKSNPYEKMAELSIAHESCHQYDHIQGLDEGLDHHSNNFQKCMQRLAAQGAFEKLW